MKLASRLAIASSMLAAALGAQGALADKPAPAAPAAPPKPSPAPAIVVTGFATPESVLWDEGADRYLVSNINGQPLDKDNNGFITILGTDGKVVTQKWIEGGKNGVTLNAPKGSALVAGVFYVADIDTLRMFDGKTGAPKGAVELKGATFANDVVAGADGKIYVSDTGMGPDFKPNGTEAVWVVEGSTAKKLYAKGDLGAPNGLAFSGKDLVLNAFGSSELFKLSADKGKLEVTNTPNGGGDGLFIAADGTVWTSSWGANAIYKGKLGGTFTPVVQNVTGPADFAVNTKKKHLVLPRFMDGTVEFYDVK